MGSTRVTVQRSYDPFLGLKDGELAVEVHGKVPTTQKTGEVEANWVSLSDLLVGSGGTDQAAIAKIDALQSKVDTLPTGADVTALKAALTALETKYKGLDTSKANAADLVALQAALKALEDAVKALPSNGTAPDLTVVNNRIAALENALNTAENSKGIIYRDEYTDSRVGGNLYGGLVRLTSADINRTNQNGTVSDVFKGLDGNGSTDFYNISNEYLTYFLAQSKRLWKAWVTHQNITWANREVLLRKASGQSTIALTKSVGEYTSTWKSSDVSGHQELVSAQIKDDGGRTYFKNLYLAVSDPLAPASAPKIGAYTLQVGDRFRYEDGTTSVLYVYQGINAASGAWWAKPLTVTTDNDIAKYSVVNPRLSNHDTSIASLEAQLYSCGNMRLRRENRPVEEADIDGTWDVWVQYTPQLDTAIYRKWEWVGENIAGLVLDQVVPRSFTEASAVYNSSTKTYKVAIYDLAFEYSKVPISQLDNQYFNPPVLVFRLPNGNLRFTSLSYKAFDNQNTEITNGGGLLIDGENLTAIPANPVIKKIKFQLLDIANKTTTYEVSL